MAVHADPLPPHVHPSSTPPTGAQDRTIIKRSLFNVFRSNSKEISVAEVKVKIDFVSDASHTVHLCTVSSENETIQQGDPPRAVVGFTHHSDPLPLPGGSIPQPMSTTFDCGEPPGHYPRPVIYHAVLQRVRFQKAQVPPPLLALRRAYSLSTFIC